MKILIKIIALVTATIKTFVRNWKSVLLLVLFPLILVMLLLFSFNPQGLQKIPVGFIGSEDVSSASYAELFPFLKITSYPGNVPCINDIKLRKQYACVEITQSTPVILNVYYDNTRSTMIWEVLDRIKTTVDYLQKKQSEQQISGFLGDFKSALDKLQVLQLQFHTANGAIGGYIGDIDSEIIKLSNAKNDLATSLDSMDSDINSARQASFDARQLKNNANYEATQYTNNALSQLYGLNNLTSYQSYSVNSATNSMQSLRARIADYDNQADSKLNVVDQRISSYQDSSMRGRQYIQEINNGMIDLQKTKSNLYTYKSQIQNSENDMVNTKSRFDGIKDLNSSNVVNPIVLVNTPTYLPSDNAGSRVLSLATDSADVLAISSPSSTSQRRETIKEVNTDVSLLSLQTLFPIVLFLVIIFLSLLISSFISLDTINSSAIKRTRLIKNIAIPLYLSMFISTMIIVFVPVLCILLVGNYFFKLDIISNIFPLATIIILTSGIFIMLGILLSQIIKKESLTLLTSAFVLIFCIFLSGMILPTEKMSYGIGYVSDHFPGSIGIGSFDKIVFYGQGISSVSGEIVMLVFWILAIAIMIFIIEKFNAFRKNNSY